MGQGEFSVSRFIEFYPAESTRANHRSRLKSFFLTIYPRYKKQVSEHEVLVRGRRTPENAEARQGAMDKIADIIDVLSLRYVEELKSGERDIREDLLIFKKAMEGQAPNTIKMKLGTIKRLLEFNEITIPKIVLEVMNGASPAEPISDEYVPTRGDISKIIEFMPLQAKALTLVLASSGMRIGETLKLRLTHVDFNKTPTTINLRSRNTKTQRKRIALISAEATKTLKDYLDYRPEFIKIVRAKGGKGDENLIFPFSSASYYGIWENAVKKSGLYRRDEDTNRLTFRPHNLRKFFRTRGDWVNPDIPEALMGHTGGIKAVYARYDQAQEKLAEEYLKAEPSLTLSEYSAKATVEIAESREKSQQALDLALDLREENKRLKEMVENLAERLGQLDGLKERIEELEIIGAVPGEKEALRSIPKDAHVMTEEEKARARAATSL